MERLRLRQRELTGVCEVGEVGTIGERQRIKD